MQRTPETPPIDPGVGSLGQRDRNRLTKRARILEAARSLFGERGFDDVTMSEVAHYAGVSRATVFNLFGGKRALIEGITVDVLDRYQSELDRVLGERDTPTPAQLRHLFSFMGHGIESQRHFHRSAFREIARVFVGLEEGGPAHAARRRNLDALIQLMTRGQARGEITRARRAEDLATALDGIVFGTITHWLYDDATEPLAARMERAAEVLLGPIEVGTGEDGGHHA